ncbi:MAG: acyl-CoA dehydrogenase family protein [Rhizobacter sp.]|nr:acyl-CoA dehydrogenase family protein [Chlorobiales bacterium]
METTTAVRKTKGGEFLIKETPAEDVFIAEEFDEDQKMIAQLGKDFLVAEVYPKLDEIDSLKDGVMAGLMTKAGEQGLLGISVPEAYSGFGKDFNTTMVVAEVIGAGYSFAVAFGAHTGIGTLPILFFGTDAQKQNYLPKLATGEWKAAYCLTEPGSGSDAMGAKTKAILDGDHWILNGQKIWITNAGFADLFIVFAQVPDAEGKNQFTGFIVERDAPGVSLGEEEHKMGIKGSSTRQVYFTDCRIPKENLLGEIGKGHKIAFNILNIGRIKLGASALGASKQISTQSVQYAVDRKQFGKSISTFGAMQYKLAEQAIRIYALESALYRTGKDIEDAGHEYAEQGESEGAAKMKAAEEYAIECAMLKVFGSEVLDYVVDEGVQIFGGYGFSAEYPMDRAYRDSRINRIFEGTNEINRMLTVDMVLKRALKGQLNIMGAATAVQKELMSIPSFEEESDDLFAKEKKVIVNLKKSILMVAGFAAQKFMQKLGDEQEILMNIADMAIDTFVAESTLLRAEKLISKHGKAIDSVQTDMMRVFLNDATERINIAGKNAIAAMTEGDEQRMLLLGLKRFTKITPFNTKDARRRVAQTLIDAGKYAF